ncbi:MAG: NAD(P)/FAD-dependent oxidoreductase [Cryomorphaceae bacterium]
MSNPRVAVIGGGAAGFFAALSAKHHHPACEVVLFEKSNKVLSKVKVSGGGRCNVTHAAFQPKELLSNYPRGQQFLKKAFKEFTTSDTVEWFASKGLALKTEEDGRMFPTSNSSQSVIDVFIQSIESNDITLRISTPVNSLGWEEDGQVWSLRSSLGTERFHKVIIATGGSPKSEGFDWIRSLGHSIVPPVPSLFTFNLQDPSICALSGVSVPSVRLKIRGTSFESSGPMLITHWGFSGPAVLRTSAFAARHLADRNYAFSVQVNWMAGQNEEAWRSTDSWKEALSSKKKVSNQNPTSLPARLWHWLLLANDIDGSKRWLDLSKKDLNRIVNALTNDDYKVAGKTTFKEEFVTSGGVDLSEIEPLTSKSRVVPELYFAGEVMDIDGVTGGFNFQAAWTTAWIAGQLK